jgi:hypothetical protein
MYPAAREGIDNRFTPESHGVIFLWGDFSSFVMPAERTLIFEEKAVIRNIACISASHVIIRCVP